MTAAAECTQLLPLKEESPTKSRWWYFYLSSFFFHLLLKKTNTNTHMGCKSPPPPVHSLAFLPLFELMKEEEEEEEEKEKDVQHVLLPYPTQSAAPASTLRGGSCRWCCPWSSVCGC